MKANKAESPNIGTIIEADDEIVPEEKIPLNITPATINTNLPLIHLYRQHIWKKQRWFNSKLKEWLDKAKPDLIFFHCSNSMFMFDIATTCASYLGVPIIFEIADDYYFFSHFSLDVFYYIYRSRYKTVFKKMIHRSSGIIYLTNKMKRRYDDFFGTDGVPVYISSTMQMSKWNGEKRVFRYFGNVDSGRASTLRKIGKAFARLNLTIEVYCPSSNINGLSKLRKSAGITLKSPLPYNKIKEEISKTDVLIYIETFKQRFAKQVEYSLSTKMADYLSSGKPVLAFGSKVAGAISFLEETKSAVVIDNPRMIEKEVLKFFSNDFDIDSILNSASQTVSRYFVKAVNETVSNDLIEKVVDKTRNKII